MSDVHRQIAAIAIAVAMLLAAECQAESAKGSPPPGPAPAAKGADEAAAPPAAEKGAAAPAVPNSAAKGPADAAKKKAADQAASQVKTFDLGSFEIHNYQPTYNKVPTIRFAVHLVLPSDVSGAVVEDLGHWKQRIRDQAITAVRSAENYALAEPSLDRVQRLILLRIQRLTLPVSVASLYLTDFSVTEE